MSTTGHTERGMLSDERLSSVIGWAESYDGNPGSYRADNVLALKQLLTIRKGIRGLQARCCGSDDLCNGCRALLALLSDEEKSRG